jgi:hypothetical protein
MYVYSMLRRLLVLYMIRCVLGESPTIRFIIQVATPSRGHRRHYSMPSHIHRLPFDTATFPELWRECELFLDDLNKILVLLT